MLPNIKTILYATDLSGNSSYACRYAVYLAKISNADIHVLYVAERLPADALDTLEDYLDKSGNREQFLKTRLENSKRLLKNSFEKFWESVDESEKSLRTHIRSLHVVESQPAEAIVKHADKVNADIIIMGTHQKGRVQAFLGSISRRVLSMAQIPTLVVPISDR